MMTNTRSEVRVDAKVDADFGVADALDLDVFNIGTGSLPLACPLCKYSGPFSRTLVTQSPRRVSRSYECPTCRCIITVTIRV